MSTSPGVVVDFTSWYAALANAVPWLFAGPNGVSEGKSLGAFTDAQRLYLKQGIQQRFADFCSPDALPYLGGDRKLVQGPSESNANFQIRIKTAWGNSPITVGAPGLPAAQAGGVVEGWALAGTWLELLVQLNWGGFAGAVIVQQNGLAYTLSGSPTAGTNPTSLLTITNCNALTTTISSSVTPTRTIPSGTPWWYFDADTDHCSRFAVLFPGPLPSVFVTSGVAVFTGTEDGSALNPWPLVTWNNSFVDTTYKIQVGAATVTSGGPVSVAADNSTKTTTGVRIAASASFVGSVDVLAYQAGANPYADLHPADLARLKQVIRTWRPNALCMGIYAVARGKILGWPVRSLGVSDGNIGPSSVVSFFGAF